MKRLLITLALIASFFAAVGSPTPASASLYPTVGYTTPIAAVCDTPQLSTIQYNGGDYLRVMGRCTWSPFGQQGFLNDSHPNWYRYHLSVKLLNNVTGTYVWENTTDGYYSSAWQMNYSTGHTYLFNPLGAKYTYTGVYRYEQKVDNCQVNPVLECVYTPPAKMKINTGTHLVLK